MLRDFGLVDLRRHIRDGGGVGGGSLKVDMISEAGRHIFGINMGGRQHGGTKGWEKSNRALWPVERIPMTIRLVQWWDQYLVNEPEE